MAPAALLTELVKAERFGVKNGHGFYEYEGPDTGMLDTGHRKGAARTQSPQHAVEADTPLIRHGE